MEFLRELLASIGGFVGVTLIILVFFKGIIQKWIDKTIDKAAEKSLAKYSNTLKRKTKAYEMLLEKELSFYERTSQFSSDLCKNLAELVLYSGADCSIGSLINEDEADNVSLALVEKSTKFTQDQMINSTYIPDSISLNCQELVEVLVKMQAVICKISISLCKGELTEEDKTSILKIQDDIDEKCSKLMTSIKYRLIELSE